MRTDDITAVLNAAGGWRKSIRSEGANACVEITHAVSGWVGIRDSKLGQGSPVLAIPSDRFTAFLASAHANHE